MALNDAHCHFFSTKFFAALGKGLPGGDADRPAESVVARLGWESPGTPEQLAERWVSDLDRHGVGRAALIASVPGDADSVAIAAGRHPRRFVGFFMVDPTQPGADLAAAAVLDRPGMRTMCLFPAMHRYPIADDRAQRIFAIAAAKPGTAVFVHCGVLSVGVRSKLGLKSPFDMRFGNPIDLHATALAHPGVPIVIPHFGAGYLREALMVADLCPNIVLDTSSSNSWMKYERLTLAEIFKRALDVVGPDRLLFGSDSSFFPRGWVADVLQRQITALDAVGVSAGDREKILGGNFDRLFPA